MADGYKPKICHRTDPPHDYLVEGYDANGDFNGSIVVTVSEEGSTFTSSVLVRSTPPSAAGSRNDYSIDYVEIGPPTALSA